MEFDHFRYLVDTMFTNDETGMLKKKYEGIKVEALHPLVLAYIGDAYFHLYVRGKLLAHEQNKVQVLHRYGSQMVSAVWQSVAYRAIESMLSEKEQSFFRRGRNAKSHVPKSASVAEYRTSTGFEALFGALYLNKEYERLYELAEISFAAIAKAMMEK